MRETLCPFETDRKTHGHGIPPAPGSLAFAVVRGRPFEMRNQSVRATGVTPSMPAGLCDGARSL